MGWFGKSQWRDARVQDEPEGFDGVKGSPGEGGGITPEYQAYLRANNLHVNPDGSEGFGRDDRPVRSSGGGWGR